MRAGSAAATFEGALGGRVAMRLRTRKTGVGSACWCCFGAGGRCGGRRGARVRGCEDARCEASASRATLNCLRSMGGGEWRHSVDGGQKLECAGLQSALRIAARAVVVMESSLRVGRIGAVLLALKRLRTWRADLWYAAEARPGRPAPATRI